MMTLTAFAPGIFILFIWTVPAIVLAAIPSFQVVFFSEDNVSFITQVIIFLIKFIGERHAYKIILFTLKNKGLTLCHGFGFESFGS